MMFTIEQAHSFGLDEVKKRIKLASSNPLPAELVIKKETWDEDRAEATANLEYHAINQIVPISLTIQAHADKVTVIASDNLPGFVDWLIVRPKLKVWLAALLK